MIKRILSLLFLLASFAVNAQVLDPVQWDWGSSNNEPEVGEEVILSFNLVSEPNWYVYATGFDPECGPNLATWYFDESEEYELVGEIRSVDAERKYDKIFGCDVIIFKGTGTFEQTIRVLSPNTRITGLFEFQTCNELTGLCLPPKEVDFDFSFTGGEDGAESSDAFNSGATEAPITTDSQDDSTQEDSELITTDPADETLSAFILLAFFSGFLALLTPCVFPMVPMTVTFFLKDKEESRSKGIRNSIIFGVSIIGIYTLLGTAIALIFGADSLNAMATHWLPNTFAFLVFFIFALSFLGMFEIVLPAGLVNKIDQKSDRGGLIGIFFMAFTLALVSFSCTFPIVGSVLFLSASGAFVKPILGMLAFSLALALPFTLFAMFPQVLKSLPKSGGWMNSVKVVLGLLELALGLKFLSVADLSYHWGILDREIYLALWIVIFAVMGFYLLGKIRFPHDDKMEKLPVLRGVLAIAVLSFVVYLIPGMFGAPLKGLAGYLPPMHTMDLFGSAQVEDVALDDSCETPKYDDVLDFPPGFSGYFDLEQALACSENTGKPVFIDFTGHGCVNCREMEEYVWTDPRVKKLLNEEFVMAALYIDDKTVLPEEEWYESRVDGRIKKTIGKQNADFQIEKYNNNAQPYYLILDSNGDLIYGPRQYDTDIGEFADFLTTGLERFKGRQ